MQCHTPETYATHIQLCFLLCMSHVCGNAHMSHMSHTCRTYTVSHARDVCHRHTALYVALRVSCAWQCTCITPMSPIYSATPPRRMPQTYRASHMCHSCVRHMPTRHTHVAHIQRHAPETYATNKHLCIWLCVSHVCRICTYITHMSHIHSATHPRHVCYKVNALHLALCVSCVWYMHVWHTPETCATHVQLCMLLCMSQVCGNAPMSHTCRTNTVSHTRDTYATNLQLCVLLCMSHVCGIC